MQTNDQATGTPNGNAGATGASGTVENDNAQAASASATAQNNADQQGAAQANGQAQNQNANGQASKQAEGEQKKDGEAASLTGAPETYADFTAPEGVELDKDLVGEFLPLAKELNLSQAGAQKLVDIAAKVITKQFEAIETQHLTWAETAKSDPEIGGEKLAENLALGKKVIDTFGGPALRKELNDSGFGNNPELIRTFAKIARAVSDDTVVRGNPSAGAEDPLAKMYPSMQA